MGTENDNNKELGELDLNKEIPAGVDRRRFLMRGATIGAAAVLTGCTTQEKTAQVGGETPPPPSPAQAALAAPPLDENLEVVKKSKGPVMTVLDEFYKVGPGPSSSHTIGPMRITYDFYQRAAKLPADQLAKDRELYDPRKDMGPIDKIVLGAGSAVHRAYRGVRGLLPPGL